MRRIRSRWPEIVLTFCVGAPSLTAGDTQINFVAPHGTHARSKFEHGFLLVWQDSPRLPTPVSIPSGPDPEGAVEILDSSGGQVAVCDVLNAVRAYDASATGVAIDDVSVQKPGFIAVAAVYMSSNADPRSLLLYFDWNGALLRRTILANKRHQIQSLEIDTSGQVWALNDFDPDNPAKFVFLAFDKDGCVNKEAVRRRRWSTDESMQGGGQISFGITGGKVWAWLPKSKTFILSDETTSKAKVKHTGFPRIDAEFNLYARKAALLPDDQLLIEIRSVRGPDRGGWFLWSDRSGWQEIAGRTHSRSRILYTVEDGRVVFRSSEKGSEKQLVFQSAPLGDLTP